MFLYLHLLHVNLGASIVSDPVWSTYYSFIETHKTLSPSRSVLRLWGTKDGTKWKKERRGRRGVSVWGSPPNPSLFLWQELQSSEQILVQKTVGAWSQRCGHFTFILSETVGRDPFILVNTVTFEKLTRNIFTPLQYKFKAKTTWLFSSQTPRV